MDTEKMGGNLEKLTRKSLISGSPAKPRDQPSGHHPTPLTPARNRVALIEVSKHGWTDNVFAP